MANKAIYALTYGGDSHIFTLPYGVCSTAAATAAKTVAVQDGKFSLETGARILVKFTVTNTAAVESLTLNVSGTGAKAIKYRGGNLSSAGYLAANRIYEFVYDGTDWEKIGDINTNTTYSNASLGQGYATCSTAASTTAKVGTLSSYALTTGGIVSVKFSYGVPANATLNINNKGAKNIYYKGEAIKSGIIKAGDIATFIYSSQYHLISIDRWQKDIEDIQAQVNSGVSAEAISDIYVWEKSSYGTFYTTYEIPSSDKISIYYGDENEDQNTFYLKATWGRSIDVNQDNGTITITDICTPPTYDNGGTATKIKSFLSGMVDGYFQYNSGTYAGPIYKMTGITSGGIGGNTGTQMQSYLYNTVYSEPYTGKHSLGYVSDISPTAYPINDGNDYTFLGSIGDTFGKGALLTKAPKSRRLVDLEPGEIFFLVEDGVEVPFVKLVNDYEGTGRVAVMRKDAAFSVAWGNTGTAYAGGTLDMWLNETYPGILDIYDQVPETPIKVYTGSTSTSSDTITTINRKFFVMSSAEAGGSKSDGTAISIAGSLNGTGGVSASRTPTSATHIGKINSSGSSSISNNNSGYKKESSHLVRPMFTLPNGFIAMYDDEYEVNTTKGGKLKLGLLEYGSYSGTGTYGSSNPNSLTFDFVPRILIIYRDITTGQSIGGLKSKDGYWSDSLIWTYGQTNLYVGSASLTTYFTQYHSSGLFYLNWYDTEKADYQMNSKSYTYYYIAIG